jgi:hypothetical protein
MIHSLPTIAYSSDRLCSQTLRICLGNGPSSRDRLISISVARNSHGLTERLPAGFSANIVLGRLPRLAMPSRIQPENALL